MRDEGPGVSFWQGIRWSWHHLTAKKFHTFSSSSRLTLLIEIAAASNMLGNASPFDAPSDRLTSAQDVVGDLDTRGIRGGQHQVVEVPPTRVAAGGWWSSNTRPQTVCPCEPTSILWGLAPLVPSHPKRCIKTNRRATQWESDRRELAPRDPPGTKPRSTTSTEPPLPPARAAPGSDVCNRSYSSASLAQ